MHTRVGEVMAHTRRQAKLRHGNVAVLQCECQRQRHPRTLFRHEHVRLQQGSRAPWNPSVRPITSERARAQRRTPQSNHAHHPHDELLMKARSGGYGGCQVNCRRNKQDSQGVREQGRTQHNARCSTHAVARGERPAKRWYPDPSSGRERRDRVEWGVLGTERGVRGMRPDDEYAHTVGRSTTRRNTRHKPAAAAPAHASITVTNTT